MKDFGLKKLYYSISEVSKLTELEQYILRYWETEFEQLKPSKNRAGNRIYTNKDIQLILKIKKLLREEKYTIDGAKKILEGGQEEQDLEIEIYSPAPETLFEEKPSAPKIEKKEIRNIKNDLEDLRKFLLDLKSKI